MAEDPLILNPNGGMPRLLEIMRRLRDPETGCPWDIEQTFKTIAPYTIEEAYEVADAIERDNLSELRDELGDLLFIVICMANQQDINLDDALAAALKKYSIRDATRWA